MVTVIQNLFGLAAGPFIAGALSDAYGLQTALAVIPLFCLLAATAFVFGSRTHEKDLKGVEPTPLRMTGAASSAPA